MGSLLGTSDLVWLQCLLSGSYLQNPHLLCCFNLGKLCLPSATKEFHLWWPVSRGRLGKDAPPLSIGGNPTHPPTHPLKFGIFRTSDLRCMPPSTTCCRAMAGWTSSPCSRRCGRTTPPPLGTSGDASCDEGRLGVAQKRHHKIWGFSKHPLQWADLLLGSFPR